MNYISYPCTSTLALFNDLSYRDLVNDSKQDQLDWKYPSHYIFKQGHKSFVIIETLYHRVGWQVIITIIADQQYSGTHIT